ncbi:RNA polymerase sigma-54 factor 1 [Sedimentisphaera cyanobacteriorum]|uniref:RNA polymerase sigma-54 factor 1 n=1 Tax=Sedimentisphaera cyanobacteriorum TaxID=1940790 RepID=A0A1Q2HSD1_9BACT|nr:RNA polymerase factor sigma-54 [Sedimentisphaera cyanobacteriorum]AQQ10174.1 RNA polymerase sigma-54 factor 1 [Sedimentisphaera cyanobacteriorum]
MAMDLQLTGQLKQELQMKLTPAMLQSMEVLQMPLMALEQKVATELTSNPVLEVDSAESIDAQEEPPEQSEDSFDEKELDVSPEKSSDSFERLDNLSNDFGEYSGEEDVYVPLKSYASDEDPKMDALQNTADSGISLQQHLLDQWRLFNTDSETLQAGEYIIRSLDERGYLNTELEEIEDSAEFSSDAVKNAHELVKQLEPAGVGARSIRECLLIQIEQDDSANPLAEKVVREHYDLLIANHLPELANKLGCEMDQLRDAVKYLSHLDTSPGLLFGQEMDNAPVKADIIVEEDAENGDYIVRLASGALPPLNVNEYYEKMAADKNTPSETKKYLQENIRSARWLIEAIAQRRETLLKIAAYIVKKQKDFFVKGRLGLVPLSMQEIADYIGVHIATVSRAVSGKYAMCPNGIVPLRDFFSSGKLEGVEDGEAMGAESVKEVLREVIEQEDKSKPFSDKKLCEEMEKKGIKIARRTVAKYRDQLGIPSAKMRKQYE